MAMMKGRTERRSNGGAMEPTRQDMMRESDETGGMMRPLRTLQNQINRVFEDFFEDSPLRRGGALMEVQRFQPRLDMSETADAIKITADVPGMSEKDIDITLSDRSLMISGERSEEHEDEGENYMRRERSYGMFRRQIPLPEHIDRDKIEADFKNGVLSIHVPKTEEAKRQWRKIKVKSK